MDAQATRYVVIMLPALRLYGASPFPCFPCIHPVRERVVTQTLRVMAKNCSLGTKKTHNVHENQTECSRISLFGIKLSTAAAVCFVEKM
jgi:hypothetical protein